MHVPGDRRQADGAAGRRRAGRRELSAGVTAVGLGSAVLVARTSPSARRAWWRSTSRRPGNARRSTSSCEVVVGRPVDREHASASPLSSSYVAVASSSGHVAVLARCRSAGDPRLDAQHRAAGERGGLRERVEDRLPPGRAAGRGPDRRDDVDQLGLAGDRRPGRRAAAG